MGGLLAGGGSPSPGGAVTARLARVRLAERAPAGADFAGLGTPTFLTPNADFYRIDVALRVPEVRAEDWTLRVHGMVDRALTLTFDDLLARPLVERTVTLTCVSNPVGGDLVSTVTFVGVDLRDLLLDAGVRPGADQVFATSVDGGAPRGRHTLGRMPRPGRRSSWPRGASVRVARVDSRAGRDESVRPVLSGG